jgi:hypothetical protein
MFVVCDGLCVLSVGVRVHIMLQWLRSVGNHLRALPCVMCDLLRLFGYAVQQLQLTGHPECEHRDLPVPVRHVPLGCQLFELRRHLPDLQQRVQHQLPIMQDRRPVEWHSAQQLRLFGRSFSQSDVGYLYDLQSGLCKLCERVGQRLPVLSEHFAVGWLGAELLQVSEWSVWLPAQLFSMRQHLRDLHVQFGAELHHLLCRCLTECKQRMCVSIDAVPVRQSVSTLQRQLPDLHRGSGLQLLVLQTVCRAGQQLLPVPGWLLRQSERLRRLRFHLQTVLWRNAKRLHWMSCAGHSERHHGPLPVPGGLLSERSTVFAMPWHLRDLLRTGGHELFELRSRRSAERRPMSVHV